jgi:ribosomal-protein-alanine N-acetyltransferase
VSLPREIVTERLRLRPSNVEDAEAVFRAWAGDAEVCRWLEWGPLPSVDQAMTHVEELAADRASGAAVDWLACRRGDDALVGAARLAWHSTIERGVGFLISRSSWGDGLGSEILSAVTDAALAEDDVVRVQATCHPDNSASLRVLEKCGYEVEGRLRRCRIFPNLGDEPQDLLILARLA